MPPSFPGSRSSGEAASFSGEGRPGLGPGLKTVFFWLLLGDFAFQFFEAMFARFVPIFLRELGNSNAAIGMMTGSLTGLVNLIFLPGLSRWCDGLRTPLGRRIPVLIVVAPLTVGILTCIGWAPEIASLIHRFLDPLLPGLSAASDFLAPLLYVLIALFHFFNMLLVNTFNWLIRDVVPLPVMSRFLAVFGIFTAAAGAAFLWTVFPHLLEHRRVLFPIVGISCAAVFLLMCWQVREGPYPPPNPRSGSTLFQLYASYFSASLREPRHRLFMLSSMLMILAISCGSTFVTLFAKETLGLDMKQLGQTFSLAAMISALFLYPAGWLCDRLSPMHVGMIAIVVFALMEMTAFLFVDTRLEFLGYSLVAVLPSMAWGLSHRAASMVLFPADRFGQFAGALNVFGCGALIAGNFIIGRTIDVCGGNYRIAFLWTFTASALALFPMIRLIRMPVRSC